MYNSKSTDIKTYMLSYKAKLVYSASITNNFSPFFEILKMISCILINPVQFVSIYLSIYLPQSINIIDLCFF